MTPTLIAIATVFGPCRVDAFVFGEWAAHHLLAEQGWGVTHVRSGMAIGPAKGSTMKRAMEIAKLLAVHVPKLPIGELQSVESATAIKLPKKMIADIMRVVSGVKW